MIGQLTKGERQSALLILGALALWCGGLLCAHISRSP
jgi:hypothetical protein